jgi:hypothetical protein
MTTTINYTVLKIQELNNAASEHFYNNISYETNEFHFKKPLSEKKYVSWENINDHIALKTVYAVPDEGNNFAPFEWHLN